MSGLLNKLGISKGLRQEGGQAKSFKESQEKEKAFDYRNRGIRSVPVDRIVGSVGRYHDFDSKFRLKNHVPHDRLGAIKKAMKQGKPLRPVELYQIKDEYYVVDGNHRIAAARELGYGDISARIIELIPSEESLENVLYRERAQFNDQTGLPYAIELTELGQYAHLLDQISQHRVFLEEEGEPVSFERAASDWYKTIYLPLVGLIQRGRLNEPFARRTVADLYAYISFHQWEKGLTRTYGTGIDKLIPKEMEDFRKKMSNTKEPEYPEMQREVTAFVLMHVAAKREYRIIEKLYALKEVREIHSVHGDVDIVAKIVLKRDLLSSDAEVIGQFVHNQIRQIPGVISTQTLIPGLSKIKKNETD
ncbi:MAG: Lrp/AsnC ligand binding domain-containing protein [Desulfobacteraceae bacterium]|jgi:DNA-binding Lrp family transcriptional regulator